ncbi:hypothetical protein [Vagococcus sp. WN89Y]|uniref:hypothetical protein n=1 Tax=Vagococcus sp. WN89Y TaxID=3457258 RepID=UPI003FCC74AF
MRWNITEMLVSPGTRMAFAKAGLTNELSVIIWYEGLYFLRPGNILHTTSLGVFVDGEERDFTIIHSMPWSAETWEKLKTKTNCPGNYNKSLRSCDTQDMCLFELCPYGIKMVE